MIPRPLEYKIHFANGECIIKHYYTPNQANGHSWVLAKQRNTQCTRVELISNNKAHNTSNGSISIISLR